MADPEQSILGIGWSFPPAFSRASAAVEMVKDDRDIKESLWILFSTMLGERIMLPKYGNQLWSKVFQAINTTLLTRIEDDVRTAILLWEARIDVIKIKAESRSDVEGRIDIEVEYLIRRTNARNNFVYPFYIAEGTIPSPSF